MKPTLSIGIPAYNEAENIGALLDSILHQEMDNVVLSEVIVVSDGSTDETDTIVKAYGKNDARIKLGRFNERSGVSRVQNRIVENAIGDFLIMMDSDILPENNQVVKNLLLPMLKNHKVGMASAALIPLQSKSFLERVLARNHICKREMYMSIGNGNNLYTAFGPMRAFRKEFYKNFRYPNDAPFDAFSYIQCKLMALQFVFVLKAKVFFRCPSNLADHKKQSIRFIAGRKSMILKFGSKAENEYYFPRGILMKAAVKELFLHPVFFVSFICVTIFVRLTNWNPKTFTSRWDISSSSKKVLKS